MHRHTFAKPQLVQIDRIANDEYRGNAGDKAFLARRCIGTTEDGKCQKIDFFEYGTTKEMKELLAKLDKETSDE